MDKFGIFELLDTLSQITSSAQSEGDGTENATATPAPPPSPDDKSFLPPDFNGENATGEQKLQRDALNALYERHESISKRIDKKQ